MSLILICRLKIANFCGTDRYTFGRYTSYSNVSAQKFQIGDIFCLNGRPNFMGSL